MNRRWLCVYLVGLLIAVNCPNFVFADGDSESIWKQSSIGAVLFEEGRDYPVEEFNLIINDFCAELNNNIMNIGFLCNKKEYTLNVTLIPIESKWGNKNEWIGECKQICDGYELVSFRIEPEADTITLMTPNLALSGKTVLSLAVKNMVSGDIVYFQTELEDLYDITDSLLDSNDEYNEEYYCELQESYLRGHKIEDTNNIIGFDTYDNESTCEAEWESDIDEYLANLHTYGEKDNISTLNVLPYISDEIFKSGPLEKWLSGHTANDYLYNYRAYSFMGTANRETHIVVFDWTHLANFTTQVFRNQLELIHNKCILYNKTTGEIGQNVLCKTPIKVTDTTVILEVGNRDSGVIIYQEQYAQISSSTANKILKCIVQWVPYLSTVVGNYETLTGSSANTAKSYKGTWQEQKNAYGKTIYRIDAVAYAMKQEGDYIHLQVEGNNVSEIQHKYSFSFSD